MSKERLKKGSILIAKTECRMYGGTECALIIGKEYEIKDVTRDEIIIDSELGGEHYFSIDESAKHFYEKYFDLKP